jgi:hypothetical protein
VTRPAGPRDAHVASLPDQLGLLTKPIFV